MSPTYKGNSSLIYSALIISSHSTLALGTKIETDNYVIITFHS
jgi:hypothetical protein